MDDNFSLSYPLEKPVWMARLARSEDPASVMEVVREFVRLHQDLWSSLPTDCQPPPFTVYEDVSHYAVVLYRKDLSSVRTAATVYALASFFSEAAHRMAVLMRGAPVVRPFFDRHWTK
jgi:hypothetical protein